MCCIIQVHPNETDWGRGCAIVLNSLYAGLLHMYFVFEVRFAHQAEVVGEFTANSPSANSSGWNCLPIPIKI